MCVATYTERLSCNPKYAGSILRRFRPQDKLNYIKLKLDYFNCQISLRKKKNNFFNDFFF